MLLRTTPHSLPCVGTKAFSSALCSGRQVQTAARIKKLQERRAKLTPAELALHTRCHLHPRLFATLCVRVKQLRSRKLCRAGAARVLCT